MLCAVSPGPQPTQAKTFGFSTLQAFCEVTVTSIVQHGVLCENLKMALKRKRLSQVLLKLGLTLV